MAFDSAKSGSFRSLPPELRIQIWSLVVLEPRLVNIYAKKLERGTDWLCSTPPPAVMHVCREARWDTEEDCYNGAIPLGKKLNMLTCLRELQVVIPRGQMGWFASVTVPDRDGHAEDFFDSWLEQVDNVTDHRTMY